MTNVQISQMTAMMQAISVDGMAIETGGEEKTN